MGKGGQVWIGQTDLAGTGDVSSRWVCVCACRSKGSYGQVWLGALFRNTPLLGSFFFKT